MAVNSYSFDSKKFAAAIPSMHPTLQHSLYRLLKECIRVIDESLRYDDRNRASHEEAVQIDEEVFFYTEDANLTLSDDELVAELKESNPEWFD